MRALLTMLAAVAVAVAAGCGGGETAPTSAPAEGVIELSELGPLAERFEGDRGAPRLVLILSPT
ncbi:MAG: hypothetical protein ICV67_04100 [Thermoleophilia bacterium]|nr:hypothetical protein [Thermoleophilia bacterium]